MKKLLLSTLLLLASATFAYAGNYSVQVVAPGGTVMAHACCFTTVSAAIAKGEELQARLMTENPHNAAGNHIQVTNEGPGGGDELDPNAN